MKIKNMTASFGKLDNNKLELKEGLNIVQAPNESGKSTWSAFIRAMLYGINTAERDKAGFLSDKTKYRPWNGKNMEGTMELRHGGHDITIQRTSLANSPMKKFSAFYSDILLPVENLSADTAGETLTGASDKVFDRTAFIRQSGVSVSGDPGLEKRIASLISTGEEQTSYSEADSKLRARQRKLRHNKTGSLPKLEAELAEEKEKLSRIEKIGDDLALVRQEQAKYEERSKQLVEDLENYRKLEQSKLQRQAFSAKKRAVEAGQKVEALRDSLTKNGLVMNSNDVSQIAGLYTGYTLAETAAVRAEEEKTAAEETMRKTEEEKSTSVFKDMTETEAASIAQKAAELNAKKQEVDQKASSIWQKLLIVVAVLGLAAAGFLVYKAMYPYAIIEVAASIACIVIFSRGQAERKEAAKELADALAQFGAESAEAMRREVENYSDICRRIELSKLECAGASKDSEAAAAEADKAKEALLAEVHRFFPSIDDTDDIAPALAALAEPMKALPQAEIEQARALAEAGALVSALPGGITDEQPDYIPTPPRTQAETERAYLRTSDHIAELKSNDAMLRGEMNALGDPVDTAAQINLLTEEIAAQKAEYDAFALAIETLADAHAELQTKFSPLMNEAAGKIMRQLTDGRYERVVFDKNFNALAKTEGDAISHDVLSLSAGTADQVYLSLRLAMVHLLLSGDEPCPIILDDVLTTFDDVRARNALNYLRGLAKDRQVILFTCHRREAEMMAGEADVNIVTL